MSSASDRVDDVLVVGGQRVALQQAEEWVSAYFDRDHAKGWFAYPYYDTLDTNDDPNVICGGDLLAPGLLNAALSIRSFAALQERVPELNRALMAIPTHVDLADAGDDAISAVGGLYEVLDGEHRPWGIRATTLSKVLHRKRPMFVPLYDEHVRRCYQDGANAPLPPQPGRKWGEFMVLLAQRMREDIRGAREQWEHLRSLAPSTPVSLIRVFDIVAWNQGPTIPARHARAE